MAESDTSNSYDIDLTVSDIGEITSITGLASPVSGNLFCESGESGMITGFIRTAESTAYNQIQLNGSLSDSTINGTYRVDNESDFDGILTLSRSDTDTPNDTPGATLTVGVEMPLVGWDTYSYADGYRRRFGFRSETDSLIFALVDYSGIGVYPNADDAIGNRYTQGYYYQGCEGRSQDEYFCDNPDYIFVIIDGQTEITADSQNSFSGTFQYTVWDHIDSGDTKNISGSFDNLQPTGSWQYPGS